MLFLKPRPNSEINTYKTCLIHNMHKILFKNHVKKKNFEKRKRNPKCFLPKEHFMRNTHCYLATAGRACEWTMAKFVLAGWSVLWPIKQNYRDY